MRLLPLACAALLAGGCSWSDDGAPEEPVVERAVRDMVAAYNAKDVDRYLRSWTERGFRRTFGVSKQEADVVPPSLNGLQSFPESRIRLDRVARTRVRADLAQTTVTLSELHVVRALRVSLVREGGEWLLDAAADVAVPHPPGAAIVKVELGEYAIAAGSTAAADTVFRARNVGNVRHELLLLRLRASGREESLGRIRVPPGETRLLVTRRLPGGTYALVCNLPAADGTPHSSKGMRTVVEVAR